MTYSWNSNTVLPRRDHRVKDDEQQLLRCARIFRLVDFELPLALVFALLLRDLSIGALLAHLSSQLPRISHLLPTHNIPPGILNLCRQLIEVGFCPLVGCPHHGQDAVGCVDADAGCHVVVLIGCVFRVEQYVDEEGGGFEGVAVEVSYSGGKGVFLLPGEGVGVEDLVEGHVGGGGEKSGGCVLKLNLDLGSSWGGRRDDMQGEE
jgi:hypothetical protein